MRQWKLLLVLALLLIEAHVVSAQNKNKKNKKKNKNKKNKKKNKKNKNNDNNNNDDAGTAQTDIGASTEPFIIGGFPARPNEYPFFTQMYWDNNPAGCGASLVANKWILTAAHCVHGSFVNGNYLRGYPHWKVGSYCRSGNNNGPNCGARESYRHTKDIRIHPQYRSNVLRWDYALVELDATVNEIPVSLDDGSTFRRLNTGDAVQSIGMGWTNDNRQFPEFLQEVTNLFLRQCPYTHESILCTNGRNFGTCKGDSGSPSVVRTNGARSGWVQVGVTSFGRVPCENHNSPDGYARVATAHSWIANVICPSYAGLRSGVPEFCPQSPGGSDPVLPPTRRPTLRPTDAPTRSPITTPTRRPIDAPTRRPIDAPTRRPIDAPTRRPIDAPTRSPIDAPTMRPTGAPVRGVESTKEPTFKPTLRPTFRPTNGPTLGSNPVRTPLTAQPTLKPTKKKKNKNDSDDDGDD